MGTVMAGQFMKLATGLIVEVVSDEGFAPHSHYGKVSVSQASKFLNVGIATLLEGGNISLQGNDALTTLDYFAATHIMNWKWINGVKVWTDLVDFYEKEDGTRIRLESWKPTTSMNDAWQIITKLLPDYLYNLEAIHSEAGGFMHQASFEKFDMTKTLTATASSPEVAIVLAGLKVIGLNVTRN